MTPRVPRAQRPLRAVGDDETPSGGNDVVARLRGPGGAAELLGPEPRPRREPALTQPGAGLLDQVVVDQAVGLLMASYGVPATAATAALRRWAEVAAVPLVHMAAGVVEAASPPAPHPLVTLRRLLGEHALDVGPVAPPDLGEAGVGLR